MGDKSKVIEMIEGVRSRLSDLKSPLLFGFSVFKGPTQAAMFVFRRPAISILVFRSNPNRPDKEVQLRCEFPIREALDNLPTTAREDEKEYIPEFVDSDRTISLTQLYNRILSKFFKELGRRIVDQKTHFELQITGHYVVLIAFSRPSSIIVEEVIADLLATDQLSYPTHYYFAHTGVDRVAYFGRLPIGVSIGEMPTRSFREDVEESWRDRDVVRIGGKTWKTTISDVELVAFAPGAIAADTDDAETALSAINLLLAALHIEGVRCTQLTSVELGKIHVNGHGQAWSWSIQSSAVRDASYGSTVVAESSLEAAFRLASLVVKEREIADILKFSHSAWIHFTGGEFYQAFILQWTIVERILTRRWIRYVDGHIEEKKRREYLSESRDLTISLIIEVSSLVGEIDQATYSESQKMRKVRNKVIHDGLIPTQDNAADCAGLASKLLSSELDRLIETANGQNASD